MSTSLDALAIRRTLNGLDDEPNRKWQLPIPYGLDGWRFQAVYDEATETSREVTIVAEILATVTPEHYDINGFDLVVEVIHASIVVLDRMPAYEEMVLMHRAVFATRYAYQVFAPPEFHVNIHPGALHLYGRLDGKRMLPEFSEFLPGSTERTI